MITNALGSKLGKHIFDNILIKERHIAFEKSIRNYDADEQVIFVQNLVRADKNKFYMICFLITNNKYFNYMISAAIIANTII